MFDPVTMTRSTSVGGGAGPAPVGGGGGGGGFCANALDAIMRGIPTQAARVMRRNPNIECPVLIIFSPLVKLALRQRTSKNFTGCQDYFSLFANILEQPASCASHFETTAAEKPIEPPPAKVGANDSTHPSGGVADASAPLPADFHISW